MERKSHRKVFVVTAIVIALMFGFSFALVPFYKLICKATGINTSVLAADLAKSSVAASQAQVDRQREVTIQFVALTNKNLAWDFYPLTKEVRVHPGENTKVAFYVKNNTHQDMIVQAIPSMTPTDAISYFHKIECFCFQQQGLKAGANKEMNLIFYVDKDLPPETHAITLAYTLFDNTPKKS